MPSLAINTILSYGVSTEYVMSGSHEQPTEWATVSPIDRDMARPGVFMFFTHTLYGPENRPLQSCACCTLPYLLHILAFSLFESGL